MLSCVFIAFFQEIGYFKRVRERSVLMVTNPVGKGTKTIGINMSAKMAAELDRRAKSMHISKSKYCKIILQNWIKSGKKMTLSEKH